MLIRHACPILGSICGNRRGHYDVCAVKAGNRRYRLSSWSQYYVNFVGIDITWYWSPTPAFSPSMVCAERFKHIPWSTRNLFVPKKKETETLFPTAMPDYHWPCWRPVIGLNRVFRKNQPYAAWPKNRPLPLIITARMIPNICHSTTTVSGIRDWNNLEC